MSQVSNRAREALAKVLADPETTIDLTKLQAALLEVQSLRPADAYDEAVVFEAGETVLRMIESVRRGQHS
jgi:hypothetical protein